MKEEINILFFAVLIILAIELVSSSIGCDVRLRTQCQTSPWNIVLGLYNTTNAHAETYDQGNYDYVLCCNFTGSHTCDGSNKIIGLYSSTNSHVEIPEFSNYTVNVCYENLSCYSEAGSCSKGGEAILSLYSETNSHIGNASAYNIKICCNHTTASNPPSPTGNCKLTDAYWNPTEVNDGGPVFLNVEHNENCENQRVEFLMYEDDGVLGGGMDEITSQLNHPPEKITLTSGEGYDQGTWIAEWIKDTGGSTDDPEYKFLARLVNNHSVNITSNKLKVLKESYVPPDFCNSTPINLCSQYNDSVNCTLDPCKLSHSTNAGSGCINSFYCSWNGSASVCQQEEKETCLTSEGDVEIGTCIYNENSNDNCEDDGYLNHSWTATWKWAEGNNFSEGGEGFVPLGNGLYAYDPNNESGNCKAGQEILRCSSKIELNFFEWINAFLIIVILFAYYFYQKRKTPKKRKRK